MYRLAKNPVVCIGSHAGPAQCEHMTCLKYQHLSAEVWKNHNVHFYHVFCALLSVQTCARIKRCNIGLCSAAKQLSCKTGSQSTSVATRHLKSHRCVLHWHCCIISLALDYEPSGYGGFSCFLRNTPVTMSTTSCARAPARRANGNNCPHAFNSVYSADGWWHAHTRPWG